MKQCSADPPVLKIEYLCLLTPQDRSELVQAVSALTRQILEWSADPRTMLIRLAHLLDLLGELDLLIEALGDPDVNVQFVVNGMEKYDKWRREVITEIGRPEEPPW